jgi:hypothetical protein
VLAALTAQNGRLHCRCSSGPRDCDWLQPPPGPAFGSESAALPRAPPCVTRPLPATAPSNQAQSAVRVVSIHVIRSESGYSRRAGEVSRRKYNLAYGAAWYAREPHRLFAAGRFVRHKAVMAVSIPPHEKKRRMHEQANANAVRANLSRMAIVGYAATRRPTSRRLMCSGCR